MVHCTANTTSANFEHCHFEGNVWSPILMFSFGFLGNSVAVCVICGTVPDARTSKFYTMLSGLACTDLAGLLLTFPSTIAAYANGGHWFGGKTHCSFQGVTMVCFGLATPLLICAISVERFLSLRLHNFYTRKFKKSTAKGIVMIMWIISVWFGVMPLFGFGRYVIFYPGSWCFFDMRSKDTPDIVYAYSYAFLSTVLMFLMLSCNTYVICMLVRARHIRRTAEVTSAQTAEVRRVRFSFDAVSTRRRRSRSGATEVRMIVVLSCVTILYTVCWSPIMIHLLLTLRSRETDGEWDLMSIRLASLNQVLDPWLYIFSRRDLCRSARASLHDLASVCRDRLACGSDRRDSCSSTEPRNV